MIVREQTGARIFAARSLTTAIAVLLSGVFALLQLSNWPSRLRYPGEEDFIEGTQLADMLHLRESIPIYERPPADRFHASNYGPLFYLLGSHLIVVDHPSYRNLRLISLLATIGLATEAAVLSFWLCGSILAALLAPLLFLSNAFVARYGVSARSDMVALLLAFSGFLLVFRFRNSKALWFAPPLMILSLFYKQQFLAAPVALVAFLLLQRRYRLAAQFICIFALGCSFVFASFAWIAFPGEAFSLHWVTYNGLPLDNPTLLKVMLLFMISLGVPLLAAVSFLYRQKDWMLICYSSAAVALCCVLASTAGADTNRFLECVPVAVCLSAAQVSTRKTWPGAIVWLGAVALSLVLNSVLFVPKPARPSFDQDRTLQLYLRSHFGPGTLALGYGVGDLVRAGLDTPITNLWHYSTLIREGKLSDREILSQVGSCHYGLILVDYDLKTRTPIKASGYYLTPQVETSILVSYELAARLAIPEPEKNLGDGGLYAWVPREPCVDSALSR
jgi:hypothetical protein